MLQVTDILVDWNVNPQCALSATDGHASKAIMASKRKNSRSKSPDVVDAEEDNISLNFVRELMRVQESTIKKLITSQMEVANKRIDDLFSTGPKTCLLPPAFCKYQFP